MIALTGLSGAGKSTAAKVLEDIGYFVVDNLPAELLTQFMHLEEQGGHKKPLAFVIDSREAEHLKEFCDLWSAATHGVLWFFEASNATLVKRFQETRRPHPLDSEGRGVQYGIEQEHALMAPLKALADQVIHTDTFGPHELKAHIKSLLEEPQGLHITVLSFGFKHGIPEELDICLDVRFLKNPYFVEGLKNQTGLEKAVQEYVLAAPDAGMFLDKSADMLGFLIPRYKTENKTYLTIAIGCTGGKHRSVVLARELARRLGALGYETKVKHRDITK